VTTHGNRPNWRDAPRSAAMDGRAVKLGQLMATQIRVIGAV
jgi:hypothetical protein